MKTIFLLVFTMTVILVGAQGSFFISNAMAQTDYAKNNQDNETNSETTTSIEMDLPTKPENQRVDLVMPSFSNPTNITNPLFPISKLHSAVLLGNIDGNMFRAETTLFPETKL